RFDDEMKTLKTLLTPLLLGLSLATGPTATASAADLAAIIPTVDRATACRLIYAKEVEFEGSFEVKCGGGKGPPDMACTQGFYNMLFDTAKQLIEAMPVFEARFGSMVAACPAEQEQEGLRSVDKAAKRRAAVAKRKLKRCFDGCGKDDEACRNDCSLPFQLGRARPTPR